MVAYTELGLMALRATRLVECGRFGVSLQASTNWKVLDFGAPIFWKLEMSLIWSSDFLGCQNLGMFLHSDFTFNRRKRLVSL